MGSAFLLKKGVGKVYNGNNVSYDNLSESMKQKLTEMKDTIDEKASTSDVELTNNNLTSLQSEVTAHLADNNKHVTQPEKDGWNNKANKTIEAPITVPLSAPWSNVDNASMHAPLTYYKDNFGVVRIQGTVKSSGGSLTVFTLPVGYRPSTIVNGLAFDTKTSSTVPVALVYINTIGQVKLDGNLANNSTTLNITFQT